MTDIPRANLGVTPPVSLAEEQELLRQIRCGQVAQAQVETAVPTDQPTLQAQIEAGQVARSRLIQANIRLVIRVVHQYYSQPPDGFTAEDLIHEGVIGLIRAIDRWQPDRGATRLSTYATWWIRQTVGRAIERRGRAIRLPVRLVDRIKFLRHTAQEPGQNGDQPSLATLAEASGLTVDQVKIAMAWDYRLVRLNAPLNDDETTGEIQDMIQAPTDVGALVEQRQVRQIIDTALLTLSAREARIIRLRFGLDGDGPHRLRAIAARFGLTKERVRQLEKRGLQKLRGQLKQVVQG